MVYDKSSDVGCISLLHSLYITTHDQHLLALLLRPSSARAPEARSYTQPAEHGSLNIHGFQSGGKGERVERSGQSPLLIYYQFSWFQFAELQTEGPKSENHYIARGAAGCRQ